MAEKKGFWGEFKEFIARGNVMDMAVGVIIGGAFTAITNSLINDVIMPLLGIFTGSVDFSGWRLVLKEAVVENGEEIAAAVAINYGSFLATILDFLIIAFAVFCLIKGINSMHRKKEEAPAEPAPEPVPEPSAEETLLTEIRDLLKEKAQ